MFDKEHCLKHCFGRLGGGNGEFRCVQTHATSVILTLQPFVSPYHEHSVHTKLDTCPRHGEQISAREGQADGQAGRQAGRMLTLTWCVV